MKLFVCGFDESTTIAELAHLLCEHGEVQEIKMRHGQGQTYYAIAVMHDWGAEQAIKELDRQVWRGQRLTVEESKY